MNDDNKSAYKIKANINFVCVNISFEWILFSLVLRLFVPFVSAAIFVYLEKSIRITSASKRTDIHWILRLEMLKSE